MYVCICICMYVYVYVCMLKRSGYLGLRYGLGAEPWQNHHLPQIVQDYATWTPKVCKILAL